MRGQAWGQGERRRPHGHPGSPDGRVTEQSGGGKQTTLRLMGWAGGPGCGGSGGLRLKGPGEERPTGLKSSWRFGAPQP